MVFISKKMGVLLLKYLILDIKSYDAQRLHFGIDHDKLKTVDSREKRFAHGKIILVVLLMVGISKGEFERAAILLEFMTSLQNKYQLREGMFTVLLTIYWKLWILK